MGCREESDEEGPYLDHHIERHQENCYHHVTSHNILSKYSRVSWDNEEQLENNDQQPDELKHENQTADIDECGTKVDGWIFEGKEVDLSRFVRYHPGGTYPLKSLRGRDVEQSMRSTKHSTEAYHFLRHLDNQKEDLVDWTKPMLAQVGSLGSLYQTWVWNPVDKPLRLFSWDLLEKLTRTNVQQVVGTWVPVIAIASALSFYNSPATYTIGFRILSVMALVLCGMAVWPLLEYSIHRWLFHLQPPESSSFLITIHFGLHGLHHKVPFDEGRLLFPPGPCSIMAAALYFIYTRLYTWWIAVALFSGTILGYLIYDLIHYYLHHGNPKDGTYLYRMKRYHNQHHFAQQELGYGISSDFWDHIFNTYIKLKKLNKPLSWDDS